MMNYHIAKSKEQMLKHAIVELRPTDAGIEEKNQYKK